MPSNVHPVHCGSLFFAVATVGVLAASLALPWTRGQIRSDTADLDLDVTLWEACMTSWDPAPPHTSIKSCNKFKDSFSSHLNASACPDATHPTRGEVWIRLQTAEGSAAAVLVLCAIHAIIIAMYTFGKLRLRGVFLVSGFVTLAAITNSQVFWSLYLDSCSKSVCQTFNEQAASIPGATTICGPALGMWLQIGGAALTFVILFPMFFVPQAPEQNVTWTGFDPNASQTPMRAAFGTVPYQPVYSSPGPAYQPAPYASAKPGYY